MLRAQDVYAWLRREEAEETAQETAGKLAFLVQHKIPAMGTAEASARQLLDLDCRQLTAELQGQRRLRELAWMGLNQMAEIVELTDAEKEASEQRRRALVGQLDEVTESLRQESLRSDQLSANCELSAQVIRNEQNIRRSVEAHGVSIIKTLLSNAFLKFGICAEDLGVLVLNSHHPDSVWRWSAKAEPMADLELQLADELADVELPVLGEKDLPPVGRQEEVGGEEDDWILLGEPVLPPPPTPPVLDGAGHLTNALGRGLSPQAEVALGFPDNVRNDDNDWA